VTLRERLRYAAVLAVARTVGAYERARTGATFNPLTRRHRFDPYPAYRRLRERDPIHRSPLADGWILSRHGDVARVLRDGRFSADERNQRRWPKLVARRRRSGLPDPYESGLASMLRRDPPDHTRLRTLVSKAFTPRAVERMRPRAEAIVKERLAGVGGEMELVRELAAPLPVMIIAEMLGVPSEDHERFRHLSDEAVRTLGDGSVDDARRGIAALDALRALFVDVVEERRLAPREDLISAMVAAEEEGDRLTTQELFATAVLILVAGNETTTNLISSGLLALLRHPEELALLRRKPERIPAAVEELLRYDSPVQFTSRMVLEDMEFEGRPFLRGEQVVLLLASANRDEEVFAEPDRLDVTRENVRHLSFGLGIHFCLGAQLARLEASVALRGLLDRFEHIELAEDRVAWSDNTILRGPKRLRLKVA
jgi:pimeloyl-[acyl-carrier protein] synthase